LYGGLKNNKFDFSSEYIRTNKTKFFKDIEIKPYKNDKILDYMKMNVV
jgi:hypothetical protein